MDIKETDVESNRAMPLSMRFEGIYRLQVCLFDAMGKNTMKCSDERLFSTSNVHHHITFPWGNQCI